VGQLRTRLQVSASRYGLTRFVGRHSELDQLQRALARLLPFSRSGEAR